MCECFQKTQGTDIWIQICLVVSAVTLVPTVDKWKNNGANRIEIAAVLTYSYGHHT